MDDERALCRVCSVRLASDPERSPNEVMEYQGVRPEKPAASVTTTSWAVSPPMPLHVESLDLFGQARAT